MKHRKWWLLIAAILIFIGVFIENGIVFCIGAGMTFLYAVVEFINPTINDEP